MNTTLFDIPLIEIILGIIILFIIAIMWVLLLRRKGVTRKNPYVEALEYLADGHDQLAIDKFKESIQRNSNNIKAYLRLGDRLREKGFARNALRIHKELTLRENLSKEQLLRINRSLLLDYEKYNDSENGILIAKKIIDEDKQSESWVRERLIRLYEKAEKWQEAIDAIKKYYKPLNDDEKRRIALYSVFQGLKLHENGKSRDGRIKFKEAVKIYPQCNAAYFYLGKSYQNEDRLEDAIREWNNFCYKMPDKAHIIFPCLEKAYFDKGIFEDIESFYLGLLESGEKNLNTVLALVEFYLKKGRYEKAKVFLEKAEEDFKDSNHLAAKKVEVLFYINQYKEAASEALKLCRTNFKSVHKIYICDECGYESKDPLWRCPECKCIDTFPT